ncbi:MAG TPA: hypothetical protein VK196_11335 [Magnetospirillum sp.]|nr:hypothetical protein [Magnetospirillum sp.]
MPDANPLQSLQVREVVALFSDAHALEAAVQDLLTHGFDHGDLSVLAREKVVRERLGHRLEDSVAAIDSPDLPRRAWVEPESRMEGRGALASVLGYFGAVTALGLTFATGGAAAAAIGAALIGAGAGAGVGAGLGRLFDQRLARDFQHQLDQGGILLWVRVTGDPQCEARAIEVLNRHGGHHVHAHSHGPSLGA